MIFAAPSNIEEAQMRYIRIAGYRTAPSGKEGELFSGAKISGLISKYLAENGYKEFNPKNPLESELEAQKFIFASPKPDPTPKAAADEKAEASKSSLAFASYLVKEAKAKEAVSAALPLTYSPTHPAVVAPLEAGGYVFYSADGAFAPQIVFTKGEKIANLEQENLVELNPAKEEDSLKDPKAKSLSKDSKSPTRSPKSWKQSPRLPSKAKPRPQRRSKSPTWPASAPR